MTQSAYDAAERSTQRLRLFTLLLAAAVLCMPFTVGSAQESEQDKEAAPAVASEGTEVRETTVGMAATIEQLVLPGSELVAKPITDRQTPLVLRVVKAYPHGDSFRYDLEYYGLEPGDFDLRDALQRKDESSMDDVPPIKVTINPVLPPGQAEPNELLRKTARDLGGYRMAWIAGGVLWVIGLFALIFVGRRKRQASEAVRAKPKSLAERLRPSIEQAIAGELPPDQLAELERMLIAFWRKRLNLDQTDASEAIATLREHEEAGDLLRQLEHWLHRPPGGESIDVPRLLEPYQDLPPDALDSPS